MADFDQDGAPDLLSKRTDGSMVLYRSTGAGGFVSEARRTVGTGWNSINSITRVAGFTVGSSGLMSRLSDGRLAHYPFSKGDWGARTIVGTGWSPTTSSGRTGTSPGAIPPGPAVVGIGAVLTPVNCSGLSGLPGAVGDASSLLSPASWRRARTSRRSWLPTTQPNRPPRRQAQPSADPKLNLLTASTPSS
ncbi:VCBS repeat-containing protein [Arthrobacter sp. ISL-5]|uniref:FG-GAP repeat domain-containing protein n=1 Tax=Arthrobacter sp. ISL-5 TaxID=2819111 RepID=UPI001BE9939D|nr:VCBS repeat-containing protein [Arthrobacter sp. ISL-5]MBT2553933.1 VCBS repeat-containing protein [Arthrobacter sp. ISL-5]